MDIKIANDEPCQLLSIQGINHQNTNASLDNAYLSFIKSSHQLLRYCLYSKSKSIGDYEALNIIPSNAVIIDELYDILADVYCLAEYLYSLNPSTKKYDCMAMFDDYKSDKFSKHFIVDKEFELMIQATLELYLVAIAYMDSNYVWSLAYKAFFDETNTMLRAYLKHAKSSKKGGDTKEANYSKPRQKALDYHDRFFAKKDSNGKFIYSGEKASRKIIEHFDRIGESLGYEPRPLAKHIYAHRKQYF